MSCVWHNGIRDLPYNPTHSKSEQISEKAKMRAKQTATLLHIEHPSSPSKDPQPTTYSSAGLRLFLLLITDEAFLLDKLCARNHAFSPRFPVP